MHLSVHFLGERAGAAACVPRHGTVGSQHLPGAGPGEEVPSFSRCIFHFTGRCLLLCLISSEKSDYSYVNSSTLFLNISFLLLLLSLRLFMDTI